MRAGSLRRYVKSHSFTKRCLLFLIWVAGGMMVPTTHAQIPGVKAGDRVKINAPSFTENILVGRVESFSESAFLIITPNSTYTVPYNSIDRLAVARGQKSNMVKGAVIGAVSGGLFLGLVVAIDNSSKDDCSENTNSLCHLFEFSDTSAFAIGASLGVLAGGITGAIIGGSSKSTRWLNVPVQVSTIMVPSHRERFGLNPGMRIRIPLGR